MANGYVRLSNLTRHLAELGHNSNNARSTLACYQPLLARQVGHLAIGSASIKLQDAAKQHFGCNDLG